MEHPITRIVRIEWIFPIGQEMDRIDQHHTHVRRQSVDDRFDLPVGGLGNPIVYRLDRRGGVEIERSCLSIERTTHIRDKPWGDRVVLVYP
jgi:hypothetical protein